MGKPDEFELPNELDVAVGDWDASSISSYFSNQVLTKIPLTLLGQLLANPRLQAALIRDESALLVEEVEHVRAAAAAYGWGIRLDMQENHIICKIDGVEYPTSRDIKAFYRLRRSHA